MYGGKRGRADWTDPRDSGDWTQNEEVVLHFQTQQPRRVRGRRSSQVMGSFEIAAAGCGFLFPYHFGRGRLDVDCDLSFIHSLFGTR